MNRRMPIIAFLSGCALTLTIGMAPTANDRAATDAVIAQAPERPAAPDRPRLRRNGNRDNADGEKPGRRNRNRGNRNGTRGGNDRGAGPILRALDTNGNGELSASEVANASASLRKLDKNNDGNIDKNELRPQGNRRNRGNGQRGNFQERMKRWDTNNDGKLSKEEAPERMQDRWDRLDTNGDGVLDAAEMQKMGNRSRGNRGERGSRRGGKRNLEREDDRDEP